MARTLRTSPKDKALDTLRHLVGLGQYRSLASMADALDMPKGTIQSWRSRDAEFRGAMDRILRGLPEPDAAPEVPDESAAVPDFLEFRRRFCAYLDHRTGLIVRAASNWYQRDAYAYLRESNRLAVVLPPGHLKTSLFSIEFPTWSIFKDRNVRLVVVQKSQDEAEKITLEVSRRLTDHDYYHELAVRLKLQGDEPIECPLCVFGDDFKPDLARSGGGKWAAQGFRVHGVTSGEKDLTFEAKGVGGQIQGVRADCIILDDIQDPQRAVDSPKDTTDKMGWFQRVILGRVTEAQKVIVLANYFSDDDFAHRVCTLFRDVLEVPVVEYPALIDSTIDPSIPDGEVRPLCSEFWTLDGLHQKRKEVGESTWFYTWMQEAGTLEERTFARPDLEAARDETFYLRHPPPAVTHIFMGVDPAISVNGYCSIVVWGLDERTKRRYLLDVFNKSGLLHWGNVEREIVAMVQQYGGQVRSVVIESTATQGSLANSPSLVRDLRALGARILTYQTATGTGARAEQTNFNISTVGGLFHAGLVSLPYAGPQDEREVIDNYIEQLTRWRTDDDGNSIKRLTRDMVMATLFAESEAFDVAVKAPAKKVKRRTVPRWGMNASGGWAWQKPRPEAEPVALLPRSPACGLCRRRVTHRTHVPDQDQAV